MHDYLVAPNQETGPALGKVETQTFTPNQLKVIIDKAYRKGVSDVLDAKPIQPPTLEDLR